MCNVCVAGEAIRNARDGARVEWSETPPKWIMGAREQRGLRIPAKGYARRGSAPLYFRARGAPEGESVYQLRRGMEPWPKRWRRTADLASVAGAYGMDVKWELIPEPVRAWVRGLRPMPTIPELRAARKAAASSRGA